MSLKERMQKRLKITDIEILTKPCSFFEGSCIAVVFMMIIRETNKKRDGKSTIP